MYPTFPRVQLFRGQPEDSQRTFAVGHVDPILPGRLPVPVLADEIGDRAVVGEREVLLARYSAGPREKNI